MSDPSETPRSPDSRQRAASIRASAWLFGLSFLLRGAVALWAGSRFPPADDGSFYHTVAARIAAGAGYTWAWPDGAVTFAAHYPVGYPALLGAVYAVFGVSAACAMWLNALLGSAMVVAIHRVALRFSPAKCALVAGLVIALHPTFVLYTAALMTEAVAAAWIVLLVAYAAWVRAESPGFWWRVPLGLGSGALVLLRPQLLPLVPVLGAITLSGAAVAPGLAGSIWRLRRAGEVLLIALACCLPWTLRNCARMDGCVFVSANGGWNLLIGTMPEGHGTFAPIAGETVPPECRNVFGEAGKDRCFGRAGSRRIAAAPLGWLALVPQKLGQLFDHGAVAGAYLQTSNPRLISDSIRHRISILETIYGRALLLAACLGLWRAARAHFTKGLAVLAGLASLSPWGYLAELCVLACLVGERPGPGRRPLWFVAACLLGLTLLTHAVFFGAPRYALVWVPWLAWLAAGPTQSLATGETLLTAAPPADDNFRSSEEPSDAAD